MKYFCIDCGKQVSKSKYKRCQKCMGISKRKPKIIRFCKDCNKQITSGSKLGRCKKCNQKWQVGENNPNWKGENRIKYFCIDCGNEVSTKNIKRCTYCFGIWERGENHPNYKHGKTHNNKCIDCGKNIKFKSIRCYSCEGKDKFKRKIFKYFGKINKPEKKLRKILNRLFFNKYKYVGNRKFFIEEFCPDFIDKKNKKIIELYGDYWHNLPSYIERDKRRLNSYIKNNYKVLIVWQKELNDEKSLISKLLNFNKII